MFESFKKRNTWDLIWELFRTDFKLKYNGSILGFIWVLTKPFAIFVITYFVISRVFPSGAIQNFPLYLLLGQMFMTFWTEGTMLGMGSLLSRAGLITKISFPRYIVLVSSTLLALVNFLINISIFFVIGLVAGLHFTFIHLVWFLFGMFLMYLLIIVASMFLSVTYVKFRDLLHIWELGNQMLFWATPVVYSIDTLGQKSKVLYLVLTKLNPISVFLTSARNALLYNDIIIQKTVFAWFGVLIVLSLIGYTYYKNSIKKIAEYF